MAFFSVVIDWSHESRTVAEHLGIAAAGAPAIEAEAELAASANAATVNIVFNMTMAPVTAGVWMTGLTVL